jgi:hypothetical protein
VPRTTIDIDSAVLRKLKQRTRRKQKTLGQLVSELLARSLDDDDASSSGEFQWTSQPMKARVDLDDKEAVRQALEAR